MSGFPSFRNGWELLLLSVAVIPSLASFVLTGWSVEQQGLPARQAGHASDGRRATEGNVEAAEVPPDARLQEADQISCWFADAVAVTDMADKLLEKVHAQDKLRGASVFIINHITI